MRSGSYISYTKQLRSVSWGYYVTILNVKNNFNLAEEKCPRQEGNVIFRGKDLRQMSTETRKLLANERYPSIFAAFGVVQSLVPVKLCFTCENSPISIDFFSLDHSSSPRFAWKMTWMLLCRHVSIVLIDSVVICILIYNDIFIFHEHLLWKNYIVIGWILFLSK